MESRWLALALVGKDLPARVPGTEKGKISLSPRKSM